jgi:AraC family transcriptional regulator, activator of mtrCDE
MVSLARVLDGLEVALESPLVVDVRRSGPGHVGETGVVELSGGACVRFSRHAVTIVPPGCRQRAVPARADRDVMVMRGRIRATYYGSVDLFEGLEEPLVERLDPDDPLRASFAALMEEMTGQGPGARAMVEALLRRCLIMLLRRHCRGSEHVPWLVPLEDARLGRALASMHARPEEPFTLPALAGVAGMSRSAFAARFSEVLGQPPMEFLKSLRLARAAQLLTGTDLPVKCIAPRVGYSSRSSFTRAFSARHGVGPTAFRSTARDQAAGPLRAAA